jgi:hypothetical protein
MQSRCERGFGRYLATVYLDGENVNEWLLALRLRQRYLSRISPSIFSDLSSAPSFLRHAPFYISGRETLCLHTSDPIFALALCFAVPDRAVADEPYDFQSFVDCGEVACVHVYQGEGVDHPQLIVDIWRGGASLNSPNYIYIWGRPPDAPLTASFYINSHLAQRIGGTQSVTLSASDLGSMLPDGAVLAGTRRAGGHRARGLRGPSASVLRLGYRERIRPRR